MTRKLILVAFSILTCSCDHQPFFPDERCLSTISHTVQIGEGVDISAEDHLLIVYVEKKSETDIPPLDAKGIPIGDSVVPYATKKDFQMQIEQRSYSHEINSKYWNWVFAFIDKNKDGVLSIGEPYGVDKNNPVKTRCRPYRGVIEINSGSAY